MKSVYRGRRRHLLFAVIAVLAVGVWAAPAMAAPGASVTLGNDANQDGTFSQTENVAKTASYPDTITFQLAITSGPLAGPFPGGHLSRSITETNGAVALNASGAAPSSGRRGRGPTSPSRTDGPSGCRRCDRRTTPGSWTPSSTCPSWS